MSLCHQTVLIKGQPFLSSVLPEQHYKTFPEPLSKSGDYICFARTISSTEIDLSLIDCFSPSQARAHFKKRTQWLDRQGAVNKGTGWKVPPYLLRGALPNRLPGLPDAMLGPRKRRKCAVTACHPPPLKTVHLLSHL